MSPDRTPTRCIISYITAPPNVAIRTASSTALWYLTHYPDVAQSGQHPLLHYLQAGAAELRNPHPRFDAAYYVDQHPEAAANPLLYHLMFGVARGLADREADRDQ